MTTHERHRVLSLPKKAMTEAIPQPPFGAIIAHRVSIGQPAHLGDGWEWASPYDIEGLGTAIEGYSFGIDALQALQLVTPSMRGALQEREAPLLGIDGSVFWQAGFPLIYCGYGYAEREKAMILDTLVAIGRTQTTANNEKSGSA